jgi:hypothetical protein
LTLASLPLRWSGADNRRGPVRPTAEDSIPAQEGTLVRAFMLTFERRPRPGLRSAPAVPRGDRDQYPGGGGTGVYTTPLLPYPAAYQVVPHL